MSLCPQLAPLPDTVQKLVINSVENPELMRKIIDESPVEDVKVYEPPKKIVILHTKEVDSNDLEMIRRHGKVIRFNKALLNTDIKKVDADYILCDANEQDILNSLEKHFNNDKDNLEFCVYCRFYEKPHYSDSDINCFSSFKDAANKSDFDFMLLNRKNFKKINTFVACASWLINFLADLRK